jgi:tRNA(Arg) A34 adenosine deaminase TadA
VTADDARAEWQSLDDAWHEAFRQAWDACRAGSIGVGAVLTDGAGRIVASSRNRVCERSGPPGEVFGSTVAHAEMNVLAQVPFRSPRRLTLTTTLQPCLQCSASIRMGPVERIRVAGADPLWDGCHDFTALSPWVATRPPVPIDGPSAGAIGAFGTLLSRFGPGLIPAVEEALHAAGQGPLTMLAKTIESSGRLGELLEQPVESVFVDVHPDLTDVLGATSA